MISIYGFFGLVLVYLYLLVLVDTYIKYSRYLGISNKRYLNLSVSQNPSNFWQIQTGTTSLSLDTIFHNFCIFQDLNYISNSHQSEFYPFKVSSTTNPI